MAGASGRRAVTLVELVVALGGVVLLGAVALPGLLETRAGQRQSKCLANLGRIGAATLTYAAEDARNQIVPLHKMDVLTAHGQGFPSHCPWPWRTALPHVFGGRTPIVPLPTAYGDIKVLQRENWWGAPTRGLNRYVYGVDASPPGPAPRAVFRCPADTGYPEVAALWGSPDIPVEAADLPCYDFLGNSYRRNGCGLVWLRGGPDSSRFRATLTSGPKGHAAASIQNPSRVVICSDPLFYAVVRVLTGSGSDFEPIWGWHGELMADNVAYCDGSAMLTKVGEIYEWSMDELEEMGFSPHFVDSPGYFLRRGPMWQMDCYPTPGALTKVYNANGTPQFDGSDVLYTGWPFDDFTENDCPFRPRRRETLSGHLETGGGAGTVVVGT